MIGKLDLQDGQLSSLICEAKYKHFKSLLAFTGDYVNTVLHGQMAQAQSRCFTKGSI